MREENRAKIEGGFPNEDRAWIQNDNLHRLDGPAVVNTNGYTAWYVNGQKHRTDGYAVIGADGTQEYWVKGAQLTKEQFELFVPLLQK
jgi:hypothetical protein